MDLEGIVNRFILSDMAILERVDEYTLYCKYLGFQPQLRTRYKSSIRTENSDDSPSFSIFTSNFPDREYAWKDSGGKGTAGDIFKLIVLLHGYETTRQAYEKVAFDFNLGFGVSEPPKGKIIEYTPPIDIPSHLSIKAKPWDKKALDYWVQFGVDQAQLEKYKVHNTELYWLVKDGLATKPTGLCFAYQIMDRFQLYQPFQSKEKKFRQNLTDRDLHGFHQLKFEQDTLIITKARKDVMCLDAHGFEAVAPRSENTLIAPEYLRYLEKKYKRILILFDNDGKHKGDEYPYPQVQIPLSSECKDPAEYRAKFGETQFINLIKTLIQ